MRSGRLKKLSPILSGPEFDIEGVLLMCDEDVQRFVEETGTIIGYGTIVLLRDTSTGVEDEVQRPSLITF